MKKKSSPLAILGGKPTKATPFRLAHFLGRKDVKAVTDILKKGPLSDFIGAPGPFFLGGKHVRSLERAVAKKYRVKHAVSFNSATTALHGAIIALGIGPGDEVIVPPYTMSASAMAILANGAVPIFADIDEKTFCLDPKSVEERVTKNTKAIMAVNLFGQAADFEGLLAIAKRHDLRIIEDNAQSPGATWRGKFAGTIGDIGVFSFNVHKTVQSGEGGVLVTNKDSYALRAQLARNHGENLVESLPHVGPIIGSNWRMTEIAAAIAAVQLSQQGKYTRTRIALARQLTRRLQGVNGLKLPFVARDNTHVYFAYPLRVDEEKLGMSRDMLVKAMAAEGFPMSRGYVRPLYFLPVFQEQKAFNDTHFPFKSNYYDGNPDYSKGSCPVAERLHEKEFTFTMSAHQLYTPRDIDLFVRALTKVLAHKGDLRNERTM